MAVGKKQKELELRRLRAGRLLLKGVPQAEVARRVGVAKSTISIWAKHLRAGGLEALRSNRPLGRPGGLTSTQRARLARVLKAGAREQGFAADEWTLPRVKLLIANLFGMHYSEPHVWRLLRGIGFIPQRSGKRVLIRHEPIQEWKRKLWPAQQGSGQRRGRHSLSKARKK